jgi:SHS2 domain-containing protein
LTPYRLIEHTADGGMVVEAATLEALFTEAAMALMDQIVEPAGIQIRRWREVAVSGSDLTDLMVNWLRELLYLFNGELWLTGQVDMGRLASTGLEARLGGETFEATRHHVKAEVKAVTYHQAKVTGEGGGWRAQVIFDL